MSRILTRRASVRGVMRALLTPIAETFVVCALCVLGLSPRANAASELSAKGESSSSTSSERQEGGDSSSGAVAKAESDSTATLPEQDAVKRGFFVTGDLGLFATLGGRWTNDPALPSRPISNIEPHLGLVAGYDVAHGPSYSFSVAARFAMALSGGSGRVSASELASSDTQTKSSDYSVLEAGVELGLAVMVADRLAVTAKVDTGAGFVNPNPTLVATDPGAGGASFAPLFGLGLGIEYFTLLNDFSVGAQIRFMGVLAPSAGSEGSEFIPGLALTFPLKYTF